MKNSTIKVLIADDEKNLREVLSTELGFDGLEVSVTDSGANALSLLEKEEFDVLLLDLNMPGLNGIEVLKKARTLESAAEVIVLTGHATVTTAVEAMKLGAYDYLSKPFNIAELKAVIEKAYEKKKILGENLLLRTQIKRQSRIHEIITANFTMLEILETVKKVALSDFPVLIGGESGVGKELVAKYIHNASARADGPFIPINCGAIPENMLESELFGHEKGAFTGAHERKLGLFEVANRGTLFLDEIGELPLQLQVKMLRVIETKSFFRLGGIREIRVDVKFVFATNKDLKAESERGNFRPDLYYRISALTLHIPPLRERKEDIPLLIEHFIKDNPSFRNKQFSKTAHKAISEYSWPGNVRELQNVVHRALLLSKNNIIETIDLPVFWIPGTEKSLKKLEDMEREHILNILKETHGHRGKASDMLGISSKTLYRKLKDYGIEV